jgi:cytochrome c oxidase assembly protein subunit 15
MISAPEAFENGMRPIYRPGLHIYACVVAGATLLLIAAGGMVTSTNSGLAVPDWPTTYGQNMFTFPISKWQGGIFYEHSHRLIASSVGMLTIGLAIWLQWREPRRWMRRLGWIALAAVICQGILGGLTVKFLLPTPISVFHACLAQTFLGILVGIAVFTSRGWMHCTMRVETGSRFAIPTLSMLLMAAVYCQLIAGAVMRHTKSGLAVPDFPLAYGQVLPKLDAASVDRYNDVRVWDYQLPQVSSQQILYHMVHRGGAVVVTLILLLTCITTLVRHGSVQMFRRPAMLGMLFVSLQWVLGAWTVLSGRMPIAATAHVAVGAATLATSVVLMLRSQRYMVIRVGESSPSVALAGVRA